VSRGVSRSALALPDGDDTIAPLDAGQRRDCATYWALRAQSEQRAGEVLAIVADDLRALGAPAPIVAAAEQSVAQEATHADVCRRVADAYDSAAAAAVGPLAVPPDEHEVGPRSRAQHVVGFCCVSETFASAYLAGCRAAASSPLAHAALHILLADEVGHGQLGWAFLASPAAPAARTVETMLVPLLDAYEGYVKKRVAVYPDVDLPAHGCPAPRVLLDQYLAAVGELVLPGFERFGVDTTAARRWLAPRCRAP